MDKEQLREKFYKEFGYPIKDTSRAMFDLRMDWLADFWLKEIDSLLSDIEGKMEAKKHEVQEGRYCNCDGECCLNGPCPTSFNFGIDESISIIKSHKE